MCRFKTLHHALLKGAFFIAMGLPLMGAAQTASSENQTLIEKAVRDHVKSGRLEITNIHAPKLSACVPIEIKVMRDVDHSMRIPVRFSGATSGGESCRGFAWVHVRYFQSVFVATDDVTAGSRLRERLHRQEQEIMAPRDFLKTLPNDALARRHLRQGEVVMTSAIRMNGLEPGSPIMVNLVKGALRLSVMGTAIPCNGLRGCARLPSGKRVEGTMENNTLIVEMP